MIDMQSHRLIQVLEQIATDIHEMRVYLVDTPREAERLRHEILLKELADLGLTNTYPFQEDKNA